MEDLNYLYSRHQISVDNSTGAACGPSRASHLALARAYALRIDEARAHAGVVQVIPLPTRFDDRRDRLAGLPDTLSIALSSHMFASPAGRSVERWENEGGTVTSGLAAAGEAASATASGNRRACIVRLEKSLDHDRSNGLVGTRFNTLQHRMRVIRRLRAEHDLMDRAAAASRIA